MFVRSPITPERSKEYRLPNVLVRFSGVLANVLTNARSRTRIRSPITPERSIEYRLTNVLVRFWSVLANVLTNAPEQEFSAFPRTAQNNSPRLRRRPPQNTLLWRRACYYTAVCDQIANKSSLFVLLNASILRKYSGLQVLTIYQTAIIAFLLKRYWSKLGLLKLA